MPAPDLSSFKVAVSETSSATKFNNLVQAIQDEFADIDPDQIPGYPGDASKFLRGDGAWASPFASWATWTPTWTASGTAPSLGNGTLTGRYVQFGKLVVASMVFTAGSTTTFGTGDWRFSLPVNALDIGSGSVYAEDAGLNAYVFLPRYLVLSPVLVEFRGVETPAVAMGQNTPFTWANGDFFRAGLTYEAA